MKLAFAPDIKKIVTQVQTKLHLPNLDPKRIVCFRSQGATARARARIWGFPHIWQLALKLPAYYCLEVISEKFDYLSQEDKIRIIIHELMHIPKNFSGALLPHRGRGRVKIDAKTVEQIYKTYF